MLYVSVLLEFGVAALIVEFAGANRGWPCNVRSFDKFDAHAVSRPTELEHTVRFPFEQEQLLKQYQSQSFN